MLFDSHCHLDFEQFDPDRDAVLTRAIDAGVRAILLPGVDLPSITRTFTLIDQQTGDMALYGAVGIHPNSTAEADDNTISQIEHMAAHPRAVAIGEIGLDYHWDFSPKQTQWRWFEQQLELAARLELPVIIHNREASDDVIAILERWAATLPPSLKERPGVLHSFSAPRTIAERALRAGFYLGFTGPITYKNADEIRHVAGMMPLERMLIETDAPYLTPTPHRGKRNEPAYVRFVAERLASLRQMSVEELGKATMENPCRLFGILLPA